MSKDISLQTITPNPPADFTPSIHSYNRLGTFRVWCQKVLPLVYDDSLSYYELLCKVVDYLNKTMVAVDDLIVDFNGLYDAYIKLQNYVNNYFATLDVQEEINNKLDEMVKDGTFDEIFSRFLAKVIFTKSFSLDNTGVEDCHDKMKTLLESMESGYHYYIIFESGEYRFNKSTEYLHLPVNATFVGNNTSLKFYDSEEEGVSLFDGDMIDYICFKNLTIMSTFNDVKSSTNVAQFIYAQHIENFIIENCHVSYWRGNFVSSENSNLVRIIDNVIEYVGRDSFRLLNAFNTRVTGNNYSHCGDDIISFHNTKISNTNSIHLFSNNIVDTSLGCGYLGCRNITIENNTFKDFMFICKTGISGSEGQESYNLTIKNNTFVNPLHLITGSTGRLASDINHTYNVVIRDNKFSANYNALNHIAVQNVIYVGKWIELDTRDVGMTLLVFNLVGNCKVENNYFNSIVGEEFGNTYYINTNREIEFINNTFMNFYGVLSNGISRCKFINNVFNQFNDHYTTNDSTRIINERPIVKRGNLIMNTNNNDFFDGDNIVYLDFTKSPNEGVTRVELNGCTILPYNYTDGVLYNNCLDYASNFNLISGYYYTGHFVKYSGANPELLGWRKLTTGNSNVLGTDWKEVKGNIS